MSKAKAPKTVFIAIEVDGDDTYFNTQKEVEDFQFDDTPIRVIHEYRLVKTQEVRRVLQPM